MKGSVRSWPIFMMRSLLGKVAGYETTRLL